MGDRAQEVRQIGMLFSLSRSKAAVLGETAALGQHSQEILAELGEARARSRGSTSLPSWLEPGGGSGGRK
jgi:crotonobetainyl-CoA:carnitine CoA-transferase CaiB-like acyl-CoA transferase